MAAMDDAGLGQSFVTFRVLQILTLIPCWAILASIISLYDQKSVPAPGAILCLFVIALLLTVWSFCILVTYLRAFNTAYMIAFLDVAGMIALIVGVALLTNEADAECVNLRAVTNYGGFSRGDDGLVTYLSDNSVTRVTGGNYGDFCGLLRGSWGLGIANIVFFFLTAILGYQIAASAEAVIIRERRHGKRGSTIVEERVVSGRTQPEVVEVVKTTRRSSGSGAPGRSHSHGHSHRVSKHGDHKHDRHSRRSSKSVTTQFYV